MALSGRQPTYLWINKLYAVLLGKLLNEGISIKSLSFQMVCYKHGYDKTAKNVYKILKKILIFMDRFSPRL